MTKRFSWPVLTACMLAPVFTVSAQAGEFPVIGAPGAQGTKLMCPPGTAIAGFHGRIGQWVDQIGLICIEFMGPPYRGLGHVIQAAVGGGGGAPVPDQGQAAHIWVCLDPSSAVSSIAISIVTNARNGRQHYLWGISFQCRGPFSSGSTSYGKFQPSVLLSASDLAPVSHAPQNCPANENAIGLNVRFGQHVNGIGLICGPIVPRPWPPANAGSPPPAVYGEIGRKYTVLGREGGALGQPTSIELHAPYGGRCQSFRHGTICWHPEMGEAYAVWGAIGDKWKQSGEVSFGYPMTDERATPDGRGRYNHFRSMQHAARPESSIFWSPQTGAHAIWGVIRDAWAAQGWEQGPLGYPTSDEHQDGKYRRVNFERGHIRWAPDSGIEIVR